MLCYASVQRILSAQLGKMFLLAWSSGYDRGSYRDCVSMCEHSARKQDPERKRAKEKERRKRSQF